MTGVHIAWHTCSLIGILKTIHWAMPISLAQANHTREASAHHVSD